MKNFSSLTASWRRGSGQYLVLLAGLLAAAPLAALAQTGGVGIGTTAPDASAALDIVSSSKGALLPRVADATAIATPATGLLVFQTGGTPGFYYNAGTPAAPSWQQIATASGAAVTASNGLTKTGQNITLGGTLTQATDVATNGNNFTLSGAGNVGIGTSTPAARLTVQTASDAEVGLRVTNGVADSAPFSGNIVLQTLPGLSGGYAFLGFNGSFANGEIRYNTNKNRWRLGVEQRYFGVDGFFLDTYDGTTIVSVLRATTAGNVGIGTTAPPGQKLEVAGGIKFTGTGSRLTFPDGTTQATAATTATGASFIQNGTTQQASSNFNVSGNGTVGGTLTAANASVTTALTGNGGSIGSVVGLGVRADGGLNIGQSTSGNNISLGYAAGSVSTGVKNQFIGYAAGSGSTSGNNNVFSGYASGNSNLTGGYNTFEGAFSGNGNTEGNFNTFFGATSGVYNTTGNNNTVMGANSGPASGSGALENATALGANVTLTTSNTVVLGNNANVGIGTGAPAGGLHVLTGNSGVNSGTGAILSGPPTGNPNLELRGGSTAVTPYLDLAETSGVDYSSRLLSSGGTLNVYGTNATALKVNGNAAVTGTLTVNGVNVTSDRRFKTNVRPLASALASVLALRGVRYEWNALGIQHGGTAGASQVGVLAQEVEKVYPELVSTDKDGYKAVNYAQLTPVLIEAFKEQQAQIEELKKQNVALQARAASAETTAAEATATLETFEARLRRLEAGSGGQAQR